MMSIMILIKITITNENDDNNDNITEFTLQCNLMEIIVEIISLPNVMEMMLLYNIIKMV